jgi:hypothetical protein
LDVTGTETATFVDSQCTRAEMANSKNATRKKDALKKNLNVVKRKPSNVAKNAVDDLGTAQKWKNGFCHFLLI